MLFVETRQLYQGERRTDNREREAKEEKAATAIIGTKCRNTARYSSMRNSKGAATVSDLSRNREKGSDANRTIRHHHPLSGPVELFIASSQ